MKTFDAQSVEIGAPSARVFDYVADAARPPEWTHAFRRLLDGREPAGQGPSAPVGEAQEH